MPSRGNGEDKCLVWDRRARHTPSIGEDELAIFRHDGLGILNNPPWELGEILALDVMADQLCSEAVLLAICRVPYPIYEEVEHKQSGQCSSVPAIDTWIMVREVNGAVAVAQWYSSHVPKDEHEAQFLVIHVPCRDDAFLSLGAGVRVEKVGHAEKGKLAGDVAILFVLPSCGAESDQDKDIPG